MIVSAALLLAGASVHAQPALASAGDCGWVHGRYRMSNGAGIHRIWMIGTDHMLNLDVADEVTPPPLRRIFDRRGYKPFRDEVFADFYVCARVPRIKGHMQRVRLQKLKNVRIVTNPGS